jgi:hypothetical protein
MTDQHAERRDRKWRKKVYGMRVNGKSVLLLAEIIREKAAEEKQRVQAARCDGCKSCRWGEIAPCPASKKPRKR